MACTALTLLQPHPGVEEVIANELDNNQELRVSANGTFLWRIVRYTSHSSLQLGFLAVTINHVISDGKSGLALFDGLLDSASGPASAESHADEHFPPSLESTVDTRPGYRYMTNVIWNELIVPKLPSFISARVKQAPSWPGRPPLIREARRSYAYISLDATQTSNLKANGKCHQVDTLHPILEMAAVVALWSTFNASEIVCSTPISIRDTARGHPSITGNYVGNLETRHGSANGDDDFWARTRECSTWLKSDSGRRQAISAMGMLAHIPDGLNDVEPSSSTPTGWESFLVDKMSRAPSTSLEVSNLGYVRLSPSAESVTFAQTPSPATPVVVNAVGHPNGLSLLVCWRAGAFAQGDLDVGDFAKAFKAVVSGLARDRSAATEPLVHLSFDDIRKTICDHK